ncbi:MAG: epoxyqueuosine reductase QueH [Bacteroidales bacterium]|nr:epoxyqueuosine reductase QueH [Bacteroidales bacterium]MDD4361250.1 epoxyqueuosine reductase QueH [Bacteroidales bacterium]MDD4430172.1 epoxyqueuosine reductase QueH [Bacteroidales bacterium]
MNYQLVLNKTLEEIKSEHKTPGLLLHVCCAPCSSYVLEYLSDYFNITLYFYNPNIFPREEYCMRLRELKKFVQEFKSKNLLIIEEANYDPSEFYREISGLEKEKEGGSRCKKCYALRLEEAAGKAAEKSLDYFTTTLSISPLKNAQIINDLGEVYEKKYGVRYLYADFKKQEGYKRSIILSKQYGLYRQDYCGCEFSMKNKR